MNSCDIPEMEAVTWKSSLSIALISITIYSAEENTLTPGLKGLHRKMWGGIELRDFCLQGKHSTTEPHPKSIELFSHEICFLHRSSFV